MTFLYVTCLAGRRHATSTVRKAGREMVKELHQVTQFADLDRELLIPNHMFFSLHLPRHRTQDR